MSFTRARFSSFSIRSLVLALLVAAAVTVFLGVSGAYASDEGPGGSVAESSEGPQQASEHRDPGTNLPYLFAVFFVTWVGFFGYVFVMSRRQREMQREIEALKRVLAERDRQAVQAGPEAESRGS